MQNADSTLSSVMTALQRAISLGVEGANGTLNASDRAAIATEVQGIQTQLLSLANLSYQGNYVFAGTATQTAPYVVDPDFPFGRDLHGKLRTQQRYPGQSFHACKPTFPAHNCSPVAGNDMFQSIQDLITGLQSGTGIAAAVTEVSNASNYIDAQRVFYGNAPNQLNSQQTYLNSDITQLAQQQNTLGGADLRRHHQSDQRANLPPGNARSDRSNRPHRFVRLSEKKSRIALQGQSSQSLARGASPLGCGLYAASLRFKPRPLFQQLPMNGRQYFAQPFHMAAILVKLSIEFGIQPFCGKVAARNPYLRSTAPKAAQPYVRESRSLAVPRWRDTVEQM